MIDRLAPSSKRPFTHSREYKRFRSTLTLSWRMMQQRRESRALPAEIHENLLMAAGKDLIRGLMSVQLPATIDIEMKDLLTPSSVMGDNMTWAIDVYVDPLKIHQPEIPLPPHDFGPIVPPWSPEPEYVVPYLLSVLWGWMTPEFKKPKAKWHLRLLAWLVRFWRELTYLPPVVNDITKSVDDMQWQPDGMTDEEVDEYISNIIHAINTDSAEIAGVTMNTDGSITITGNLIDTGIKFFGDSDES